MKALWLEDGRTEWRDVTEPERREGWDVVRVSAVGVCNTDLELARGLRFGPVQQAQFGRCSASVNRV